MKIGKLFYNIYFNYCQQNKLIKKFRFSPEKTHQLNATFQMYDLKQKNYLDKDDLKRIQNDSNGFTPTFINRLFETHVTNDGEKMSYEEFVIFQIAYNHLAVIYSLF